MPTLINNTIYLTTDELIENGVVSWHTLKDGLKRQRNGKVNCWPHRRFAKYGEKWVEFPADSRKGRVYIEYAGIRQNYRDEVKEKICSGTDPRLYSIQVAPAKTELSPEIKRQIAQVSIEDMVKPLAGAADVLIKSGTHVGTAHELAHIAACINMLATITPQKVKQIGYTSKDELIDEAMKYMERFSSFKISNKQVLYRKMKPFKQGLNIESAILDLAPRDQRGNNYARLFGKIYEGDKQLIVGAGINMLEWHAHEVGYIWSNPGAGNKFDYEETYFRYCQRCVEENKKPLSQSAMFDFLNVPAVNYFLKYERDGMKAFDKVLPHVKGERPMYSLSKGGFDGFQVDFYSEIDGCNIMLTVVAVFDYASGAITGYDCGLVENGLMVRNMYRNHLEVMNGRSYIEIESDRFSGNLSTATKQIFERCCKYYKQPAPNDPNSIPGRKKAPNPKSRYVERLVEEVNRICQNHPAWKGVNITSQKSDRHPNTDYNLTPAKGLKAGYELVKQIIAAYNFEPLQKFDYQKNRWTACIENINPEALIIKTLERATILNESTITTIRNGAINVEFEQKKFEYWMPDYMERTSEMNKGMKVRVSFDPRNPGEVHLFKYDPEAKNDTSKDIYITTVGRLKRAQRAIAEQTDDDKELIGKMHGKRQKIVRANRRKFLEFIAAGFDIDISSMEPDMMEKTVKGLIKQRGDKHIKPFVERFKQGLSTPEAIEFDNYYTQYLLQGRGHLTPVISINEIEKENARRARARERFKDKTA
jgi:hypothetical protein